MLDRVNPIARMQDEIAELRERVRLLEAALMPEWSAPSEWNLTPSEEQIFHLLTRRNCVSRPAAVVLLHSLKPDGEMPCSKILDVHICNMRRKVEPFGVQIDAIFGRGYSLRNRQHWARV